MVDRHKKKDMVDLNDEFDVLKFLKKKHSDLARLARDILPIPISIMPLESNFSIEKEKR